MKNLKIEFDKLSRKIQNKFKINKVNKSYLRKAIKLARKRL